MIDLRALFRRGAGSPPEPDRAAAEGSRDRMFPAGPSPRRAGSAKGAATGRQAARAPGALLLMGLCFVGSAGLRLADPEGALAKEAAATLSGAGSQTMAADPCGPGADPTGLLSALKQRESQLDARAAEIADRERLLQVAEAKYKEQLEALRTAEERLAATLAVADEAAEQDIERLTAVYENMNPKNAARIFESMDVTFAAGFLARMRKDTAAKIMGGMSAERAYAISAVIAGRNARAPRE